MKKHNYNKVQLIKTLKKYFGYESFREKQEEIIKNVLEKKDCLAIMPTGGGKSICFQLPALLLPGVTLVISPLIALMKDQVDSLSANGISAAFYNSSQNFTEQNEIIEKIISLELKLLYVAPESLQLLSNILNDKYISCVAIDEAHCISSWGHDFRPSYQQLSFFKKTLPDIPIIALTATADKATRQDILYQLGIPDAKQFITSFDRKNISLEIRPGNERVTQILKFINKNPRQSGIIYCLSRKSTQHLADKLSSNGISAKAYHAGLDHAIRSKVQEEFIYDKIQVVCATIAFGMGIDKSNVRWVIHYNMPKNIEGYYQEIGRGGRDGLKAKAIMFHSYSDVIQLQQFMNGAANEELQLAKLDRMRQFAEATTCRRKILLSYFGEFLKENCGNCDVCKNPPQFFNGTTIAQKALSVIARLKENEAIGVIIDVIRGSQNATVLDKQYNSIKSYGIGKDISWKDWQHYIIQLINLGFCEIAFHKNNALLLTKSSKEILFDGLQVELTKPIEKEKIERTEKIDKQKQIKEAKVLKPKDDDLFERLRKLRYQLAKEEKVPAYIVFSDASLRDIEQERPMSKEEFLEISGVGQHKLEKYGDIFIEAISLYLNEHSKKPNTHKVTYELYKKGLSVSEIAERRNLNPITIYSHIGKLYSDGEAINIDNFLNKDEILSVEKAKKKLIQTNTLKPYYEFFNEKMEYYKIRLALSVLEKNENITN